MNASSSHTGAVDDAKAIGLRIRTLRTQRQLSLTDLAEQASISKSYLSTIENGTGSRPGAAILHKVAVALGVTLADLLGRKVQPTQAPRVPESLREFASEHDLPEADIAMLAGIAFRGEAPRTKDSWQLIYNAIVMSARADRVSEK